MFQKSKLHNRANIHTFSAVSGYFFQEVTALNTYRQKQNAYLGDQMERGQVHGNHGMNCLPNPNYSEERKEAGALSHQGLFHFRFGTCLTTGGLSFVRCLGNKTGRWLAKSGEMKTYCLTHGLDTDRKIEHNWGYSVSPWESWSPFLLHPIFPGYCSDMHQSR